MELTLGSEANLKGYVTLAKFCLGRRAAELSQILGFNGDALSGGYWFCLLADTVRPDEFAYRGYTHFSGGVPAGQAGNAGLTTEEMLTRELGQTPADQGRLAAMKRRTVETIFQGVGPDRVAKVIPKNRPDAYPAGHGAPQWELLVPKRFDVVADLGPGQAVARRPDGAWITRG